MVPEKLVEQQEDQRHDGSLTILVKATTNRPYSPTAGSLPPEARRWFEAKRGAGHQRGRGVRGDHNRRGSVARAVSPHRDEEELPDLTFERKVPEPRLSPTGCLLDW